MYLMCLILTLYEIFPMKSLRPPSLKSRPPSSTNKTKNNLWINICSQRVLLHMETTILPVDIVAI